MELSNSNIKKWLYISGDGTLRRIPSISGNETF